MKIPKAFEKIVKSIYKFLKLVAGRIPVVWIFFNSLLHERIWNKRTYFLCGGCGSLCYIIQCFKSLTQAKNSSFIDFQLTRISRGFQRIVLRIKANISEENSFDSFTKSGKRFLNRSWYFNYSRKQLVSYKL